MKRFLYILLFLPLSLCAQESIPEQLQMDMMALGEFPAREAYDGIYHRIKLADCCYIEMYRYGGPSDIGLFYLEADSMLFVRTVCAPLCSSVAQIYDGHWNLIREVPPPSGYILPQAFIDEQGILTWQENYIDETDTLNDTHEDD